MSTWCLQHLFMWYTLSYLSSHWCTYIRAQWRMCAQLPCLSPCSFYKHSRCILEAFIYKHSWCVPTCFDIFILILIILFWSTIVLLLEFLDLGWFFPKVNSYMVSKLYQILRVSNHPQVNSYSISLSLKCNRSFFFYVTFCIISNSNYSTIISIKLNKFIHISSNMMGTTTIYNPIFVFNLWYLFFFSSYYFFFQGFIP